MASDAFRDSAISIALSFIRKDSHFPNNVFDGHWSDYLFFEPYMIFDACFIKAKDLLLREGDASVIVLINLGNNAAVIENDPPTIFLDRDTESAEYISNLKGDGSAMNWMFLMDRYVCASDIGNWCIYCEKENDVAVFAFSEDFAESACSQVANVLKAKSIMSISNSEEGPLFDFGKLVPSWKTTLVAEYRGNGKP